MRVLVCGGRTFDDQEMLDAALHQINIETPISLIIQGMARGADLLAKQWAERNGVACIGYRADWKRYGNRTAGPIRNQEMLDDGKPELVVAFPGGKGTLDMVRRADKAGVPVRTYP
jgi:hypothetical protein